jgi:hypothetical protein
MPVDTHGEAGWSTANALGLEFIYPGSGVTDGTQAAMFAAPAKGRPVNKVVL